jgi:hypothetical protein
MRIFGALPFLLVLAATLACYDKDESLPTAPEVTGALTLSASAASAPADGFTRIELNAQIDPRADADKRTINFSTTAGTFASNSATTLVVTADSNGRAQAFLQASTVAQTAIVEASVANAASVVRRLEIQFTSIAPSDLIRAAVSSSSAPADGATVLQVYADVAPGLPANQRTVTFTTSFGTFVATSGATATAVADGSNRATVDLRAPTSLGDARITATVGNAVAQTGVSFTRAYPNSILVNLDKLSVTASLSDSTNITTTLLRNVGTVTPNTVVTYSAVDATTGGPLSLIFRNVTPSNTSGQSTATMSPGNTTFRGTATIRARTDDGTVGTANIEIVDP